MGGTKEIMRIFEIAVEAPQEQIDAIESFLKGERIPYYIEPENPRFTCLEDVECECEGK